MVLGGTCTHCCTAINSPSEQLLSGLSSANPLAHEKEHEVPDSSDAPHDPPAALLVGAMSAQGSGAHEGWAVVQLPRLHVTTASLTPNPASQAKTHDWPVGTTDDCEQLPHVTFVASGG